MIKNLALTLMGILKLIVLLVGTLVLIVVHVVWYMLTGRLGVTKWFHRFCCLVTNIRIKVIGETAHRKNNPVIYMCNHISYIDILVLGSMLDGCFVAKSEVAGWPGFGFLSKLQKTIFIVRERSALMESRKSIADAMANDHDIILFPEGTSTDGWEVQQFKAGLLAIFFPEDKDKAEAGNYETIDNALLQPVAIKHVATDGIPATKDRQDIRDLYAWYGDMDLVPHLWALVKTWRTDVEVHMLDPLSPRDFTHRFDIANAAQERVAKALQ